MSVKHSNHPARVFIRRAGNQRRPQRYDAQRLIGQVRAEVSDVRTRHVRARVQIACPRCVGACLPAYLQPARWYTGRLSFPDRTTVVGVQWYA